MQIDDGSTHCMIKEKALHRDLHRGATFGSKEWVLYTTNGNAYTILSAWFHQRGGEMNP